MQGCLQTLQHTIAWLYPTIMFTMVAGYVVLHPGFYKDTSRGVLPEICEQQR